MLIVSLYELGNVVRVAVNATLNERTEDFPIWLEQVKDENGVPMIKTILPQNKPLEEFKDPRNDEGNLI